MSAEENQRMLPMLMAVALSAAPLDRAGLDLAVDATAAHDGFAGEVLVADGARVLYARAVSAAGRPHRRGELWRWASVSKQLTATLVLQAVDERRLSLDDTLAQRLPGFRGATGPKITIRDLLQHTSGLPNPDDTAVASPDAFPAFYLRREVGAGGPADALGYCATRPKGAPGGGFSYNNCDYIVLGAILSQTQGRSFSSLLRSGVAAPGGLKTLRLAENGAPLPRLAPGFDEQGRAEAAFTLATYGPAGAAYGSSDDLVRFDQALMGGRLLSTTSLSLAWSGNPKLGYEALGAWAFEAPLQGCPAPVRLVERRGEIGGVEVRNLIAPDVGRALVVFADRAGLPFGELWQGRGLSYRLASAAFCAPRSIG